MLAYEVLPREESLDLEAAFDRYANQIQLMVKEATGTQVQSEREAERILSYAGDARRLFKKIEAVRKELTEPARKLVASVNDKAKLFTDKLKEVETILIQKVEEWKCSLRLKAVEEEAEREELEEVLGCNSVLAPASPPATLRGKGVTSYEKTEWTFEVTDVRLIPREYLMVDQAKIHSQIKNGVRQIPGIKMSVSQKTVLRTR
jgi:hypothetical protein